MTVTIPLIVIIGVVAFVCYRYMGLKAWHLLVSAILGFLLAADGAGPQIQALLNAIFHGRHK
jgi:hypothetical protein